MSIISLKQLILPCLLKSKSEKYTVWIIEKKHRLSSYLEKSVLLYLIQQHNEALETLSHSVFLHDSCF